MEWSKKRFENQHTNGTMGRNWFLFQKKRKLLRKLQQVEMWRAQQNLSKCKQSKCAIGARWSKDWLENYRETAKRRLYTQEIAHYTLSWNEMFTHGSPISDKMGLQFLLPTLFSKYSGKAFNSNTVTTRNYEAGHENFGSAINWSSIAWHMFHDSLLKKRNRSELNLPNQLWQWCTWIQSLSVYSSTWMKL